MSMPLVDALAQVDLEVGRVYGFFLSYYKSDTQDGHHEQWIPFNAAVPEEKVLVRVGGDPSIVSTRFFVSRDIAWAVVQDFCSKGEKSARIHWKTTEETQWVFWDFHPDVEALAPLFARLGAGDKP